MELQPPLGDITNKDAQGNDVPMDDQNVVDEENQQKQIRSKPYADNVDPAMLKLTQEEYTRISEMISTHVRSEEEKHAEDEDWKGLKHSLLVEWFCLKNNFS